MNKALYNWLDKIEGKKVGTIIKNINKEKVRQGYKPKTKYGLLTVNALKRMK